MNKETNVNIMQISNQASTLELLNHPAGRVKRRNKIIKKKQTKEKEIIKKITNKI